ATRGGAASTRPEFRAQLKSGAAPQVAAKLLTPAPPPSPKVQDNQIHVQPVQGNIYMLVGPWGNTAASVGKDGILLVDAGPAEMTPKIMSAVLELQKSMTASTAPNRCLGLHCAQTPGGWTSPSLSATISSPAPPKPIRFIIDT